MTLTELTPAGIQGPSGPTERGIQGPSGPTERGIQDLRSGPAASGPAEYRGSGRDDVRLLVAHKDTRSIRHHRFVEIVDVLAPGDVLVVNTSSTLPAAVPVLGLDGPRRLLHLSTPLPGGRWMVELRTASGTGSVPSDAGAPGEELALAGGATATLVARHDTGDDHAPSRLWLAQLCLPDEVTRYLARHGRPIRYAPTPRVWPIADYQTVFAVEAGSAEMPSAARAFTPEVVTAMVSRGVAVVPLVLHAGVSSPEESEAPSPEYYRVPPATARWVNVAKQTGSRVVAVGTTVVRALETVTDETGLVHPGEGWTDLVIGGPRGVRVVDSLLTGWHEPVASHLAIVEAVTGRPLLEEAYREAADEGYLWHEFGDLCLVLR
jgi:S-adenosylmethionine:tRNA ribosyltransferase-isomerase